MRLAARWIGGDGGGALALSQEGAHGDPESPGQGKKSSDGGLALPRLEAGEVGRRKLGPLGQLLKRQPRPGALIAQALGDRRKRFLELHHLIMNVTCLSGKRSCQGSRDGNVGEMAS